MRRALGLLVLAALQLGAAPVRSHAPTGDVLGVSVLAAPGRAEVVVDIRGPVGVTDFVLTNPARLVLDLGGARLVGPSLQYDGVNRAGIRNIRYSQFRPDVVRVVIELDDTRDYQMVQGDNAIRVTFAAAQSFAAWPNGAVVLPAPAPAPVAPAQAPVAAPSRAADLPAAIPAPAPSARPRAGDAPLAAQQPRISVTFDAATIDEVIANFAAFSGRSIITGKGIAGNVTAEIHDQPWDVAFNAILASQGLAASELPGGIIRVDSRANLAAEDSTEPVTTQPFKINYARASALLPSIQPLLTPHRGAAAADTTTNSLIITDLTSRMGAIREFITHSLDVRTPQVAIQAKIIFVDRTNLEALGLRYDLGTQQQYFNSLIPRDTTGTRTPVSSGTQQSPVNVVFGGSALAGVANASAVVVSPTLELIYTTVLGNYALSAFLQAAEQMSLADVQAEPQVTVVDNHMATIFVGQRTPIRVADPSSPATSPARVTVQLLQTGIKLEATPHVVTGTREILMELHAERSSVDVAPTADVGGIFGSQEGTTQILVRDGETAVIGGLTVTSVSEGRNGIPFLMDLPVVGRLFGVRTHKEERQDLLILVTPHIVDDMVAREGTQP
jgi:type IV pilus assembly protein PilQ